MTEDEAPLVPSGYTFAKELGTGAYGKVYLCKDVDGKAVAVKVATSQKARRRSRREGELLELLRHPNVLHHFATIEGSTASFIVTEFLGGGDLLHFMKARGCRPLPDPVARNYFSQLVNAVDYLHRTGIVHRDIKCENILLSTDYQVIRLADFGFACPWRQDQLLYESLGSLHYASPEMCSNTPYHGPEADIWSMGVVLYAILVGRLPFGGKTEEELSARIKEGTFHTPSSLPQVPAALMRWLLHTDAGKRITMDKVKTHAWLSTPLIVEMPRSSSEPLPRMSTGIAPTIPISTAMQSHTRRTPSPLSNVVGASASPSAATATPPSTMRRIPHTESMAISTARTQRLPTSVPISASGVVRRASGHAPSTSVSNFTPAAPDVDQGGSTLLRRLSRFLGGDGTRLFSFSRIIHKDKEREREPAQLGTSPE